MNYLFILFVIVNTKGTVFTKLKDFLDSSMQVEQFVHF